jgi:hypothetical protein
MLTIDGKEYYNLAYLMDQDFINEIPSSPGNYFWVHYPNIPLNTSLNQIKNILNEYSKIDLNIPVEGIAAQKYYYKIGELGFFNLNGANTIFGLNKGKEDLFIEYLSDTKNIAYFIDFFKDLCFKRPFYIGKAKDIKSRIIDHIEGRGNSPIKNTLNELKVNKNHIWIGFDLISPVNMDDTILYIFEEIAQKKLKPGLTKKFGQ